MDRFRLSERTSRIIDFNLYDEDNALVPAASVNEARLTLFDLDTYVPGGSPVAGILNDRNEQDILNLNDVTVSDATDKLVTWTMQPEDNVIVTPRRQIERHRAEFTFILAGGAEVHYQCELEVVNFRRAA